MSGPVFMGIDGGGSTLRIAVVDADLTPLASITESSANPNIIGHEAAQKHILSGIAQALALAGLKPSRVTAVCVGIAGASNLHSRQWLLDTVEPVLPQSFIVPSSDLEIALVGALAQRHGILLLAGTGSAAFGIAPTGRQLQIGGWGYLLGDEGSSYWIGMQLLRNIIQIHDKSAGDIASGLHHRCLAELGLSGSRDLIAWLYRADEAPAVRVASLARFVLQQAECGNGEAIGILQSAASQLVGQAKILQQLLEFAAAPVAFAGGLLDNGNILSDQVARGLELQERPVAKHAPVIGAALLAKLEWRRKKSQ